jgi:mono/diheme cytochrome c family protein
MGGRSRTVRGLWLVAVSLWCTAITTRSLQAEQAAPLTLTKPGPGLAANATGAEIYGAACATCHGPDGKGAPRSIVGFDTALPDFTDCAFATAEADVDWMAVVHEGGRIRGLSRRMPAFGDALTSDQIAAVVGYVRHFCSDTAWPRGDLNFPRALFTEKAFPENEVVLTNTISRGADPSVGNELVYERRFGSRNQIEVVVPVQVAKTEAGWNPGLGDVAFAFRRTVYSSTRRGSIAAAGGEVAFPTGDAAQGLGNGFHVFEPFGMFDQALPGGSFLQLHGGLEIPSNDRKGTKEAYLRTAIGFTHMADRSFGRSWSPQIEILWARPFGEPSEWDLVPQLQVSLSKIQHVMIAGVRVPLNERDERGTAVVSYLLWDWFDGPFTKFWK